MNPEEKSENDLPGETGGQEGPAEEPAGAEPGPAEQGEAPRDLPDAEEGDGPVEEALSEPAGQKREPAPRADGSRLKSILEALIFVSEQPISLDKMAAVLTDCSRQRLKEVLGELEQEYAERAGALEIVEVANGYQFRTRAEFAPWLGRLRQQKFARLSRAALETLAIVAYRQPVTRAEAEAIRGVDSGAVLGTLLERRLLRILGRKEVPGRPILYGTTHDFLELFGLKSLKDLPTLREIKDMVDAAEVGPGRPEGEEEEAGAGEEASEERVGPPDREGKSAETGERGDTAASEEEDEDEYEDDDEYEGDEEYGGDSSEEEEPLGDEEITPHELDEILKSTRTRLEIYEEEMEGEEGGGGTEPMEGKEGLDEAEQGDDLDED